MSENPSDAVSTPGADLAAHHCLVTIYGPKLGERIALDVEEVVLGRSSEADVIVPLHDVSRRHCRFRLAANEVFVQDLASTNGTFLNGEETGSREVTLRSRDLVKVGGAIFRYLRGSEIDSLYREEVHRVAIIDGLTEAYNERYLREFLTREIARSRRHDRPLSLLMFDVDGLGAINEAFGRLAGDAVLRDLAARVKGRIRAEACFARVRDDEFAIALPELGIDEAQLFAQILSERVSDRAFEFQNTRFAVTITSGATTLPEGPIEADRFLQQARDALELAKNAVSTQHETRELRC